MIDGRHIVAGAMTPQGLAMHVKVPLLLGSTRTEATLFFRDDMRNFQLTEPQMRLRMRQSFTIDDAKVSAIMAAYRETEPGLTPSDMLIAVASEVQFRLPLNTAAGTKPAAPGQAPVFLYSFD